MDDAPLEDLEQQRARLYEQLAATRAIPARLRQRELPPLREAELCVRAAGSPRPWATLPVDAHGGRARHQGRQLSADEVDKVRAELANYHRFADVSEEIVAVNEAICEARPPNTDATTAPPAATGAEKELCEQVGRSSRPR